MQFTRGGPDIPEQLLQAHEEGRVVFFCGAGISYPAGLPGFKGLVESIYQLLGTIPSPTERAPFDRGQFDATLDLLERRIPGQRIAVRSALANALQPRLRRKGATDTHAALLQLARSRDGALRLVTTNFDRVFEWVNKRTKQKLNSYSAPMLPIPKNSRWNGIVYLHGLLPEKVDAAALHRLVLTSGDFGLAYLTERWAARFVSELFRNYVVCFVGYSINDPVLRYMMDALAADRMLGELTPQAYALGDCEPGTQASKTVEWEAKGVTPILYEVPVAHDHSALHATLKAWGETHRDGSLGKERIVLNYALARPSASTRQDDFVGRMLWALSHESGLPAKRFAEFNPVPPLEWLEALSEGRFLHADLDRFGVPPKHIVDDKLRFSLIHRPTPYQHAPWMVLVTGGATGSQWDAVMFQLARWLVRHLNDPTLIIWLAQHGGQLHDRLLFLIDQELDRFARLQQAGSKEELEEIRAQAPNAIPGPLIWPLWRVMLSGRVKAPWRDSDLYRWKDRFKRHGLTATLRLELRELLAPKIKLAKPFRLHEEEKPSAEPRNIKQLVDWELVLTADSVRSTFRELSDERWQASLPALLDEFQQLLLDALDLLRELGEADERSDRSHWDLPSISEHWQNRGFRDWATLIELLRDAWLAVRERDPEKAKEIALAWFNLRYSTFKRLALFAASQDNSIAPAHWVAWLLSGDAWWLWSVDTQRETLRLIVLQGAKLLQADKVALEKAILAGPPRSMYRNSIEQEHWRTIVDRSIWLRLEKLKSAAGQLESAASQRLDELSAAYPNWRLASDERDEFSHWMSVTGDPDFRPSRDVEVAPRKWGKLVQWLQRPPPKQRPFDEDTWREICRTRFFHSFFALCALSKKGEWPAERWKEALGAWSENGAVIRSWRFAAPLLQTMPALVFQEVAQNIAWWMEAASKSIECHEGIMLDLCRRILALPLESDTGIRWNGEQTKDLVTDAINHPIGNATQALINVWFRREPSDNDSLSNDIEPFFTRLCNIDIDRFRHGRVILASNLISLFRVDRVWTEKNLLPLLDWERGTIEANAVWQGFLWSPRLYRPLLIAFKSQFLSTANHYADLGEYSHQFAAFLTYAALDPIEDYTLDDFQAAIGALPQEGLQEVAQALSQALEGAGGKREEYWKNRVFPLWQKAWPKSSALASDSIAVSLARMCIAAGNEFPSALGVVEAWLRPIEHPDYVVHLLHQSDLCARFPETALRLLNAIVDDQRWAPRELMQCLDAIAQSWPASRHDLRHRRLVDFGRRRGL